MTPLTSPQQSPWSRLSDTQRAITLALLSHGRLSRPELMSIVGISSGSVTRLTAPMVEAGLLSTSTEQVAGTGRPQSPLEVRAEAESLVGVTITGEDLTAALTDLRLQVLATTRRSLPSHSPKIVVAHLSDAVNELSSQHTSAQPTALAVTLGGTSRDGRIVDQAVFLGWHGVHLADMIEAETGLPTTVGNDVAAMTQQEAWFGAGREADRFTLVTVGSGVGHGLAISHDVISTADADLGLTGLMPIPDDSHPPLTHPAMDCLTDGALEAEWLKLGLPPTDAASIVSLARHGDPHAVALCAAFARRIGRLIAMSAAFTLPQVIVVAGERASIASLFEEQVMTGIAQLRHAAAAPIPVIVREHNRSDWARGAAALAVRARVQGEL
ncbi:MAG: ROK family transcriptional regulator [Actinomyces urogenitalis]|nr:ROK family transcriptional regulator [Actinomyces urogenitalis]MBS5976992.1 ROK family transcriptional regulator [Actinomyces urogenitalis]